MYLKVFAVTKSNIKPYKQHQRHFIKMFTTQVHKKLMCKTNLKFK